MHIARPTILRMLWTCSSAWLLAACAVGPNYHGAPTVVPAATRFVRSGIDAGSPEPAARWWTLFGDVELNRLMDAAVAANPSVELAQARLREARAALRAAHANELPKTGASAAYLRVHNFSTLLGDGSGGGGSSDLNLFAIGFDATWEIDFYGAKRRAAEEAAAASQGARADLADALVSLTAEVAQAYVQLRDAQQRLALTQPNIEIEERLVELMLARQAAGAATDLDVARLANQLDTTRATLGALRAGVTQQLDRLALLTAREAGSLDAELSDAGAPPPPPATLAIGDPASLLRRRPDIAVAERKLAQQTAAIGENVAALFPKVTLLGDLGFAALTPAGLFNHNGFTYVAAPMLQWTPWDFGRTRAHIAQARAERDEAEADYRRVVLAALEDAETSLAQFGEQRDTVQQFAQARASAQRVYTLTELRLRGGTASTTDVLDADAKRLQADLSYEQALAQLSQDFIAVEKSLGLGWEPAAGS
jgi:outer membrane protein, multidrug efflux system